MARGLEVAIAGPGLGRGLRSRCRLPRVLLGLLAQYG